MQVNQLSESIFGKTVFSHYQPPSEYTGEQFGVQYLYQQTGRSFNTTEDQLDSQIDEGYYQTQDRPNGFPQSRKTDRIHGIHVLKRN